MSPWSEPQFATSAESEPQRSLLSHIFDSFNPRVTFTRVGLTADEGMSPRSGGPLLLGTLA